MGDMQVPQALRIWFVVHAAVDLVLGLPLLIAPEAALPPLGWASVDPAATRLVGAALLALGAQSFLFRNAGVEIVRAVVQLNALWSMLAAAGLMVAVGAGAPAAAWAGLSLFIAFSGVWLHHAIRFRQLAGLAGSREASDEASDEAADEASDDEPRGGAEA